MVEIFAGEKIASGLLKLAAPFAGAAALVAAGFGAGLLYEHKAPWALGPQLQREIASRPARAAAARQQGADAQHAADKPAFDQWAVLLASCRAARISDAAAAQTQIDAARHSTTVQASAAYSMGRATCGATHATSPSRADPAPAAGRVPDGSPDSFRVLFGAGAAASPGAGPMPPAEPGAGRAPPA